MLDIKTEICRRFFSVSTSFSNKKSLLLTFYFKLSLHWISWSYVPYIQFTYITILAPYYTPNNIIVYCSFFTILAASAISLLLHGLLGFSAPSPLFTGLEKNLAWNGLNFFEFVCFNFCQPVITCSRLTIETLGQGVK